jgi:hypothetical protein
MKKTIASVRKKHTQNNLQEKSNKFTLNNAKSSWRDIKFLNSTLPTSNNALF